MEISYRVVVFFFLTPLAPQAVAARAPPVDSSPGEVDIHHIHEADGGRRLSAAEAAEAGAGARQENLDLDLEQEQDQAGRPETSHEGSARYVDIDL